MSRTRRSGLAVLVAVAALAVAGAGCEVTEVVTEPDTGGTEPAATEDATTEASAGTETGQEPTTAKVGDALTLRNSGDVRVKVTLVKVVDPAKADSEFLAPAKGHRYVAVRLKIENVGEAVYDDSPSNGAVMIDSEDQQYQATLDAIEPGLIGVTLRQGDTRAGFVSFELPDGAVPRTFQLTLDSGFGPEAGEWTLR